MAEIYISTTLRHFQTDLDNFYSRDFELCGTVYRRLDLAYFAYLYRAFNRARVAYLNCEIEESHWLRCASRWREIIAIAFDALNLHEMTDAQFEQLLITPAADDPDQYDRVPGRVNIFIAHSDYAQMLADRTAREARGQTPNGQSGTSPAKPAAARADYQTRQPRSDQAGLFEEGII